MKKHLFTFLTLSLVLLLLQPACVSRGSVPNSAVPCWQASPLPQWDEAFRRADPRWRGADSASSVPLSAKKTLWLFGDTWIANPETGTRKGGDVIRNSFAVQEIPETGPGKIKFHWKEREGRPGAAFLPEKGPGWLWPLSGVRTGTALYLFFTRLLPNDSSLGFEVRGSLLVVVSNPEKAPEEWVTEQHPVPFSFHGSNGDLFFGIACLVHRGFVYVFGVREDWSRGMEGRSLLVGRSPLDAFHKVDFTAWRFRSEDGWTKNVSRAAALFEGAAPEMSVSFFPALNGFLAVYTSCGLSRDILARLAPEPWGPWGKASVLFQCPETSRNKKYFCYAGKAHPELSRAENERIVTYAANSSDPEDHYRDALLYWPRFVRVTLEKPCEAD